MSKKLSVKAIISIALVVMVVLSSAVAMALTVCVSGKEHLASPSTKFTYTTYGTDRKAVYTVGWKSAYAYARCIFTSLPDNTDLSNDSGRVWKMDKPQATAYGKGNANGYWGHNCAKSN
jgi:hypothetical protein